MKQKTEKSVLDLVIAIRDLKNKQTSKNTKKHSGGRIDSIYSWIGYEMCEEMTNQGWFLYFRLEELSVFLKTEMTVSKRE